MSGNIFKDVDEVTVVLADELVEWLTDNGPGDLLYEPSADGTSVSIRNKTLLEIIYEEKQWTKNM